MNGRAFLNVSIRAAATLAGRPILASSRDKLLTRSREWFATRWGCYEVHIAESLRIRHHRPGDHSCPDDSGKDWAAEVAHTAGGLRTAGRRCWNGSAMEDGLC